MKSVRLNKRAASFSALVVTLPLLAMLCRGYAPKPYDAINLPFWEREAPTPVVVPIPLPAEPAPTEIRTDSSQVQQLLNADEDKLLAPIENATGIPGAPKPDGAVGDWLTAASRITATTQDLDAKRDRIAIRLLSAQQPNGYFGAHAGKAPISAQEYIAQAKALSGLTAYFRKTRSPVVVLSMLRSGDYLATLSTQDPQVVPPAVTNTFIQPLADLYLQTGAAKYLHCAQSYANSGTQGIAADCALYRATSDKVWLAKAEKQWRVEVKSRQMVSADDSCALFRVTMSPKFLSFRQDNTVTLDPDVQFGIMKSGLLVAPAQSAGSEFHGYKVAVDTQPTQTKITLVALPKSKSKISLRVLALCGSAPGTPVSIYITDKKAKPLGNTIVKAATYRAIFRNWHSGDTVTIEPIPAVAATSGRQNVSSTQKRIPNKTI
jgi:hypothetical protein